MDPDFKTFDEKWERVVGGTRAPHAYGEQIKSYIKDREKALLQSLLEKVGNQIVYDESEPWPEEQIVNNERARIRSRINEALNGK